MLAQTRKKSRQKQKKFDECFLLSAKILSRLRAGNKCENKNDYNLLYDSSTRREEVYTQFEKRKAKSKK